MSKPSMQMIADIVGVSKATVSNALNNKGNVQPELKNRIIETANKVGYVIKNEHNTPEKKHLYTIVVTTKQAQQDGLFFNSLYSGLMLYIIQQGNDVNICILDEVTIINNIIPDKLKSSEIVFLLCYLPDIYLNILIKQCNGNVVCLIRNNPMINVNGCYFDDYSSFYALTSILINKNYKNIYYVREIDCIDKYEQKITGYRDGLINNGYKYNSNYIIEVDFSEYSDKIFNQILNNIVTVGETVFICDSDLHASILMNWLIHKGYKVPEDFLVTGYISLGTINKKLPTIEINKNTFYENAYKIGMDLIDNLSLKPTTTKLIHETILYVES